jgi:hypothetical protein
MVHLGKTFSTLIATASQPPSLLERKLMGWHSGHAHLDRIAAMQ